MDVDADFRIPSNITFRVQHKSSIDPFPYACIYLIARLSIMR